MVKALVRRRTGLTIAFTTILHLLISSFSVESKLRYLTYLHSKKVSASCSSLRSALSCGTDLTVIGLDDTEHKRTNKPNHIEDSSSAKKVLEVSRFLRSRAFGDDDIVVYNEGSTTLYAANQTNLESAFLRIEKPNTIIFSATKNCWTGYGGCAEPAPSIHTSFKYASSDGWIARHKVAADFYTIWSKALESEEQEYRHEKWALLQITKSNGTLNPDVFVAVDHDCTIFQTSDDTNVLSDLFSAYGSSNPHVRPDGSFHNPETKEKPFFFHFDEEKNLLRDVEELVWNSRKVQLESSSELKTGCAQLALKYPLLSACNIGDANFRPSSSPPTFNNIYPTQISVFHVRKDVITGQPVQRNRVHLLKRSNHTLSEYLRILQCPKVQPDLHGKGGALTLAKYIPLTRETVLLTAAHSESNCGLWNHCRVNVENYLAGKYPPDALNHILGGFHSLKMFRVMNGTLYLDWPWGAHRFSVEGTDENYRVLFFHVLDHVSDVPDSVFFAGGEMESFRSNMPVPNFSSSPGGSTSSDIPAPWNAPFLYARSRDRLSKFLPVSLEALPAGYHHGGNMSAHRDRALYDMWMARIDKAAFFGSLNDKGLSGHAIGRQVVYNLGTLHPEHLVANWTLCFDLTGEPHALN